MITYEETWETRRQDSGPYLTRTIEVFRSGEPVGTLITDTDLQGNTLRRSVYHKPVTVYGWDAESKRSVHVAMAESVSDGKRVLAEWWKKNGKPPRRECNAEVRYLPADPNAEFYPTPSALAGKMLAMVDWKRVSSILEPSAGKGDLLDCARRKWEARQRWGDPFRSAVDCIEKDENLRHILSGRGYRVVGDDFLRFTTEKRYDLILMNPPFSNGDEHLLRAIAMQENGGQIVCLLNAETVRNPCTSRRKELSQKIREYGASVRYVSGAFDRAERKTGVEIAIVSFQIPETSGPSFIFDGLRRATKEREEEEGREPKAMTTGDWVEVMVSAYNMEAKAGSELIREFFALAPYIRARKTYEGDADRPLLTLNVEGVKEVSGTTQRGATINAYLRALRKKYWGQMMDRPELAERMTGPMRDAYQQKIAELEGYDFSTFNIRKVIREVSAQLCRGVEDSILALFDKLSERHSWYPECDRNIHYFNGWATNKAHKVNEKKVILPCNGYDSWHSSGHRHVDSYRIYQTISDIERALSYLDGEGAISRVDVSAVAKAAEEANRNTMDFSYFSATFYKKGTCHIRFHEDAKILVERLNIFAARSRAWLPPSYGKKTYAAMTPEEQGIVDCFQGAEEYEKVVQDPDHYIIAPSQTMALLTA